MTAWLLLSILSPAGAQQPAALAPGQAREEELLREMDAVLNNPKDAAANAKLHRTAELMVQEESRTGAAERAQSMEDMESFFLRYPQYQTDEWRQDCEKAIDLAGRSNRLYDALVMYQLALSEVPHTAAALEYFSDFSVQFYANLARGAADIPGLERRRLSVGLLAGRLIQRQDRPQEEWPYQSFEDQEQMLIKAAKIREREDWLAKLTEYMETARTYLGKRPTPEALAAWRNVVKHDPQNWEGRSYVLTLEKQLAGPPSPPVYIPPIVPKTQPAPAKAPERPAQRKLRAAPVPLGASPAPVDRAESLYREGVKAYALGDPKAAIQLWEECLEIDPGHAKAKKALAHAQREMKEDAAQ